MGIVASSAAERETYDILAAVVRRIVIGKAPLALVAGAAGVPEAEMKTALLMFLTSCRTMILADADAAAILRSLAPADPPEPPPPRIRKRPAKAA